MQWPIDRNNAWVQFMTHLIRALALSIVVVVAVLFAFGAASLEDLILMVVVAVALTTVVAWSWLGIGKGSIGLDRLGIVVNNKVSTQVFHWEDVESVELTTVDQMSGTNGALMRLLMVDGERPFVLLHSRRMLKASPPIWPAWRPHRFYTSGTGIPLFRKQISLYPLDPATFVSDAQRLLAESRERQAPT